MASNSKQRKFKKFMTEAKIITGSQQRLDIDYINKYYTEIFDLKTREGSLNFQKLISIIYEPYPHESIRIKVLIFLHFIMLRSKMMCEQFQSSDKQQFLFTENKSKSKPVLRSNLNYSNSLNSNCKTMNTSCRSNTIQEISYNDLSQYLHLNLTLPYYAYLMKVSVNCEFYALCRQGMIIKNETKNDSGWNVSWRILNAIRCIITMKKAITNVGRYYLTGCEFILDLIEIVSNDATDLYEQLQRQVDFRMLHYQNMNKIQLQNLIAIIQEVTTLNEYFAKLIRGVQPRKWISIDSESIQKINFLYLTKYGMIDKKISDEKQRRHWKQSKTQNRRKMDRSVPVTMKIFK